MDTIASGLSSKALRKRLQTTEAQLDELRAASRVIDAEAIMAAIPAAVARHRELAASLGSKSPIDIEAGREIIRGITGSTPLRPGEDGVPVAMLALSDERLAAHVRTLER